ncbi:MAG: hypothetical protein L6Q37_05670, partial [Bdellovibrionaceae bacterium]|nr:hypothetical protein [Pseudobdellovibrionaceae bacterium]
MIDHLKKSLLIAFVLCFLHNKSWSVISNDIDKLGESSKILSKEEKPDLKSLKNKDDNALDANFEVDDSDESLLAIEALLQSDINEEKRNSVLIQKAMIELEQGYKKKKIKTEKKENIDSFFKKAKASVDQVIFNGKINQNKLAYAYFIKALVNNELEEFTEKKQNLEKSFKISPASKQSSQIAMALGEIYFEENNYKQAYEYFNIKYKELSASQKIISDYKSAWCLLLQSKYDQAVNSFLKIIEKNEGSSLKNDAIRDLAYAMTLFKKENEMIQFAAKNLKSQNQTDFLYFTLRYFYFSPKKEFKSLIFKTLLNQRLTAEKRIAILSLHLNFKRDIYPNLNYKVALNFTMKNLSENSIYPESQLFQTSAKEIESINEFFIKQYLDVILKKLPNKANLTKEQLLNEMLFHIKFHLSTFPQSSFKYQLVKLGIDAETETKNGNLFFFKELLEKEKLINDEVKSLICKIDYELLQTKLKETASTTEILENHIESINKLLEKHTRLQECKFLSSSDEIFLKDKLFQLYFSIKDYQNAAKTIDEIYQNNKTENILYNRYLIYFNLGMFEKITSEVETHKKVTKPEIKKIIRESFLKLAQGAGTQKENFNFSNYERNIVSFIKTSDDKAKITSAYLDYFEKIQTSKDSNYLAKVWQGIPFSEKNDALFIPFRERLINKLLISKEFDKVNLFIDPVNSEYLNFLYFFNKQQNKNYEIDFNSSSFQKLSNA